MASISVSQTLGPSDSGQSVPPSPTSPLYHFTEADYTGETVDDGTFRLDCLFKITIVVGETQVALLRGSGLGELKACQVWSVLSTSADQEPESPSPTQTASIVTPARARSTTSTTSVKPITGIARGPSRLQRPSPSVSSFRPLQVTSPTLRKTTPSIFETIAPQSVYQCDQPAPKERGIIPTPVTTMTTGAKRAPQTPGTTRGGTATPSTSLYKRSCQCWEQKRRRPIPDAFFPSRTPTNPGKCTQPGCSGGMVLDRDLISPLSEVAEDQPHFSLAAESPPHDFGPVSEKTAYFTMDDTNDLLCFYGVQAGKYRLRVQAVLRTVRLDSLSSETGGAVPAGPVEGIMLPFIPWSQKNNLTVHLRHPQHTTTGELEPWITTAYLSKSVSTSGPSQSPWNTPYTATTTVRFTFAVTHELGIGWGPANTPAEQVAWYKQHLSMAVDRHLTSLVDTSENSNPLESSTWTDPGIRHRSVYSSDPEVLVKLVREKTEITPKRWEYRVEQSALFTLDPHRWQCTTTLTLTVEPTAINADIDPWQGGQFAEFTFTLLTDAPKSVQLTQVEYEHDIVHWQVIYPDEPEPVSSYPSTPSASISKRTSSIMRSNFFARKDPPSQTSLDIKIWVKIPPLLSENGATSSYTFALVLVLQALVSHWSISSRPMGVAGSGSGSPCAFTIPVLTLPGSVEHLGCLAVASESPLLELSECKTQDIFYMAHAEQVGTQQRLHQPDSIDTYSPSANRITGQGSHAEEQDHPFNTPTRSQPLGGEPKPTVWNFGRHLGPRRRKTMFRQLACVRRISMDPQAFLFRHQGRLSILPPLGKRPSNHIPGRSSLLSVGPSTALDPPDWTVFASPKVPLVQTAMARESPLGGRDGTAEASGCSSDWSRSSTPDPSDFQPLSQEEMEHLTDPEKTPDPLPPPSPPDFSLASSDNPVVFRDYGFLTCPYNLTLDVQVRPQTASPDFFADQVHVQVMLTPRPEANEIPVAQVSQRPHRMVMVVDWQLTLPGAQMDLWLQQSLVSGPSDLLSRADPLPSPGYDTISLAGSFFIPPTEGDGVSHHFPLQRNISRSICVCLRFPELQFHNVGWWVVKIGGHRATAWVMPKNELWIPLTPYLDTLRRLGTTGDQEYQIPMQLTVASTATMSRPDEQLNQSGFYHVPLPVFSIPVRYLQVKVGLPESLYKDYRITSSLYEAPLTADAVNATSQSPFHQQAYECTLLEPEDSAWLHVGILEWPVSPKVTSDNPLDDGTPSQGLPSKSAELSALASTQEKVSRKDQACQTEIEQPDERKNAPLLHPTHTLDDIQQLKCRLRWIRVQRNALFVLLVAMILGWYLVVVPLSDRQDWHAAVHSIWVEWRSTSVPWLDHSVKRKENVSETAGKTVPITAPSSIISTDLTGKLLYKEESDCSSDAQLTRTLIKDESEESVSVSTAEVAEGLSNVMWDSTADLDGATASREGMGNFYLDSLQYFIRET
ncbi:hypothetical protein IWQ61_001345, partial [Dispira simplex]